MLFDKLFSKKKNRTPDHIPESSTPEYSDDIFEPEDVITQHSKELFKQSTETISLNEALKRYTPDFIPTTSMDRDLRQKLILYGNALGDISGSKYEGRPFPGLSVSEYNKIMSNKSLRSKDEGAYPVYEGWKDIDLFSPEHHFTDDTVMTIAVYKATQTILHNHIIDEDAIIRTYTTFLKHYYSFYPDAGFARGFENWAMRDSDERNFSFGNGACMRVGGIAVLCDNIQDVIKYAYHSAVPSHSHAEGIKGAVCTAVVYWMLVHGASKQDVLEYIKKQYPVDNGEKINGETTLQDLIDMNRTNPWSTLSVVCQTSLVEAVINFVSSESFEDCLRAGYKYLSDTDTISAIAAPMAAIFYKDISVRDPLDNYQSSLPGEALIHDYLDERL